MSRSISNNIIIVNYSDRFSNYLTGSSVDNTHMKSLSEFNNIFENYPLTVEKIIVFESAIVDIGTMQEFSNIILSEYSQVGEIIFLVSESFKNYFDVSLSDFKNKTYLPLEITNRKLEDYLTERQAFKLKNKAELGNIYQINRKEMEKTPEVPKYRTYITVGRSSVNPKIDKEIDILNQNVIIEREDLEPKYTEDIQFNYLSKKPLRKFVNNTILVYDSGLNVHSILKSEYADGRKILLIDNTDSMLFSFLVENDEDTLPSISLEYMYREGMNTERIKEFFNREEICIIRNSYVMKTSANQNHINDMIAYIIGNYGNLFHTVIILTDDMKMKQKDNLRYIFMPASMDNLMKLINYIDVTDSHDLRNIYVKLIIENKESNLMINESVIRSYTKNMNINNVVVIENPYTESRVEESYLLDIIDIELGRFIPREVEKDASNVNRKERLSTKPKLKRRL